MKLPPDAPSHPALPDKDQCAELLHRLLKATRADAAEASLEAHVERLTAFAANTVRHTISEERRCLSLAAVFDRRVARVSTTRTDGEAVGDLARRAEAIARLPREPDLEIDLAGPAGSYPPGKFDAATAFDDHDAQVEDVEKVIRLADSRRLESAGFLLSRIGLDALINSRGLEAFNLGTEAEAALTLRRVSGDLASSGYRAVASWRAGGIRLEDLASAAANKALWGGPPVRIPPGEYPVILEPLAVAELLLFLAEGFNARSVEEEDSYLTGKLGEDCFSPHVTLLDDFSHPLQRGIPFDGEGWPKRKVTLVDRGRVSGLLYDRATAARRGAEPTGHGFAIPNPHGAEAANLVLAPGDHSNEQLVSESERAVLITRFWYVRPVDPGTITATGITRDGTFLIEGGRVVARLEDLRWNESLLGAFARLDAVGRQTAVVPMDGITVVTPAVRIPAFRFVS